MLHFVHSMLIGVLYIVVLGVYLSGACGLMWSVLREVRVFTCRGTLKSSSSSANAVVSLV